MLILALDSCGRSCGVCVWQDGLVLAQNTEAMERGQDARLMPMVIEVLQKSGHKFSDLDKIAVTRGPGSFTGMRVGLAAARGIGIASGKSVIGIDRFAIYAMEAKPNRNLLVVINSKRAELFCRFFPTQSAPHEAVMMTQTEIDAFVATHPNTDIAGDMATLDADILSATAMLASQADGQNPDFQPSPLYLRAPDVTFASAKAR